jgi:hypothetical protein
MGLCAGWADKNHGKTIPCDGSVLCYTRQAFTRLQPNESFYKICKFSLKKFNCYFTACVRVMNVNKFSKYQLSLKAQVKFSASKS